MLSSQTGDVYLSVCMCVHLLAKSGNHGGLLNQGVLNDTLSDTDANNHIHSNTYSIFFSVVRMLYDV